MHAIKSIKFLFPLERLDALRVAQLHASGLGGLPEQIEVVSSKYALEGNSPPLEDVPEWIDMLIAKRTKAKARAKDTAMALAYGKAKRRAA